jgi:hypothetical protein
MIQVTYRTRPRLLLLPILQHAQEYMRVTTHAREFRRLYRFKEAGQPLPADVASKLSGGISSNFH